MPTFNGHKNWNYWNVSLWINNDQALYNAALDCIRTAGNRKQAAEMLLRQLPDLTPDGAPYSVSSIKAAMVGMEK